MVEGKTTDTANFVLFGCGRFAVDLVNSKYRWYRYDLIWHKNIKAGFLNANLMPMRNHESILVFGRPGFQNASVYHPQKTPGGRSGRSGRRIKGGVSGRVYANVKACTIVCDGMLHPCSVLPFKSDKGNNNQRQNHPTQKPLALMEWLVKTYTNEGDIVVDPFMGSGTTGVACARLGRRFIGIEKEQTYFDTAVERIKEVQK
jgi:hypothetical protein